MRSLLRIAVLRSHGAVVQPSNPEFFQFFWFLRKLAVLVDFHGRPEELEGCDALLIGGPQVPFDDAMLGVIQDAIHAGCHALVAGHAGGDAEPLYRVGQRTNLGELCEHIRFDNTMLFSRKQADEGENSYTLVPFSPLHDDAVCFRGCSLSVDKDAQLLSLRVSRVLVSHRVRIRERRHFLIDEQSLRRDVALLARIRLDEGNLTALCGAHTLADGPLGSRRFGATFRLIFTEWLAAPELRRRMRGVQRHRLLHGYPMQPLAHRGPVTPPLLPAPTRDAIVGVLPHAFCNPMLEGCGFCAFPHDPYNKSALEAVTRQVIADVRAYPGEKRPITALYLGGATANLTPPELLDALAAALVERFSPREVTLEGVPRYFQLQEHRCLEIVRERFPKVARRISMGVQTFDAERLRAMGRAGFGDARTFAAVTERAQAMGFAVSADLLINLPGQSRTEILDDLDRAVALGLDQICVYHLVLGPQLDVPWARDPAVLARLPTNATACESWCAARERLLEAGYVQRTLTNFIRAGSPAFLYEEEGFRIDRNDTIGFGPGAITRVFDPTLRTGRKVELPVHALEFLGRQHQLEFDYQLADARILWLTRALALLRIDAVAFAERYGYTPTQCFPGELEACVDAGLLETEPNGSLRPTPVGMFYADAIAGLLAASRVLERQPRPESPEFHSMTSLDERWRYLSDFDDAQFARMG